MAQKMFFRLLPVLLTALVFTAVLMARGPDGHATPFPRRTIPHEAFQPDRCTWSCHNHGCEHAPRLPDWLSGDAGLFGWAVRALHRGGSLLLPGHPREGYGLINLLIFCVLWPAAMWGLYLVAVGQRRQLRALRRVRP